MMVFFFYIIFLQTLFDRKENLSVVRIVNHIIIVPTHRDRCVISYYVFKQ